MNCVDRKPGPFLIFTVYAVRSRRGPKQRRVPSQVLSKLMSTIRAVQDRFIKDGHPSSYT